MDFPPSVTLTDGTTAWVHWRMKSGTTGKVEYGTTIAFGTVKPSTTSKRNHRVEITGLSAATNYYYKISIDGTADWMEGTFTMPTPSVVRLVHSGEHHHNNYGAPISLGAARDRQDPQK